MTQREQDFLEETQKMAYLLMADTEDVAVAVCLSNIKCSINQLFRSQANP